MNTINLDKILEEARNRQPVMEVKEIESLLQNKTEDKKAFRIWKNISIVVISLLLSSAVSFYFINDANKQQANKTIAFQADKSGNDNVTSTQKNEFTELERTNSEKLDENIESGNARNNSRRNTQNQSPVFSGTDANNAKENANTKPSGAQEQSSYNATSVKEKETFFSFKGWDLVSKVPAQFGYGLDKDVVFNGNASAYIHSMKSNYNSAWLTQEISAAPYAGKRLKMTAMVKSENAGKKAWAGIFMNIKGSDYKIAGYDNLFDKNITGKSDWTRCELVMDIPADSKRITFGLYKVYGGNAWIDNIHFDVVNSSVPLHYKTQSEAQDTSLVQPDLSTKIAGLIVEKPVNLDFEKLNVNDLPEGWHIGEEKQYFRALTDDKIHHGGNASVFLQSTGYVEKDWNTLMQYCKPGDYAGKRLKISAWVRTEDLKQFASFIFRVDGFSSQPGAENIKELNFTGNNNWRKTELILDIPETATNLSYGLLLEGKGKVWMDDITIEEMPGENVNRNNTSLKSPVNLDFEE